jgi:predicted RNA-binding Zn ribbon-like protein
MEVTRPVDEGSLRLVREFVNTRDIEAGTDALADPDELAKWLRHNDLLGVDPTVQPADLDRAVELREAVRSMLTGGPPASAAAARLTSAARRARLRPEFTPSGARLVSAAAGVDSALGALLIVITEAMADGRWRRLKVCDNDACRWAFFDASRASSGKWCSMAVCGNRSKAAAWRTRQRGD